MLIKLYTNIMYLGWYFYSQLVLHNLFPVAIAIATCYNKIHKSHMHAVSATCMHHTICS